MTWWWIPLVAAVPGFFVWAAVHEGAHALAALACGCRVTAFQPWPHRAPDGRFAFAWMTYEGKGSALIDVAPYVLDALAFAGLAVGFWMVDGPAGAWGLATSMGLPAVNSTVGVLGRFRGVNRTDLAKTDWKLATPFLFLVLAYWAVLGAAVLRLLT